MIIYVLYNFTTACNNIDNSVFVVSVVLLMPLAETLVSVSNNYVRNDFAKTSLHK